MTAHKKGEMVKGASPYDFLPYSAWGEDMNAVSFVQSSPGVMPRDAPLPDSFDLDNWSKMKADPMHGQIYLRSAQICYMLSEYDRMVYLAN